MDRRIRRYVAAKQKLIALLEEEKQAVINQAVTRGLDPNVRLKPSGVEWLGDVPAHWEVAGWVRFRRSIIRSGLNINRPRNLYRWWYPFASNILMDSWCTDRCHVGTLTVTLQVRGRSVLIFRASELEQGMFTTVT